MYSAHEIRTIIKNCTTIAELRQVEFLILLTEAHNYSITLMQAFEACLFKQRLKISNKYTL